MKSKALLYLVILLEGYIVLASELIAIRQSIPFVGSGTESIAIIIAAVLMPLAFGYYAGGRYRPVKVRGKLVTIREKLIRNVINSSILLTLGLSYLSLEIFYALLTAISIENRIAQTAIYSFTFLVYPVFLLGQTVPLISNYFSRDTLSETTGKMLFCSTVGSFGGSIISTLVLMTTIGVNNTVIVNVALLTLLVIMLSKRSIINIAIMAGVFGLSVALNSNHTMSMFGIIENNNYNTIAIIDVEDEEDSRILVMNRTAMSKISADPENHYPYLKYVQHTFFDPLMTNDKVDDILVVGAGGFSIGLEDTKNQYVFIDIDPSLKRISEESFLKQKLTDNKIFYPEPARAFMRRDERQYDVIFLDAFSNPNTIPQQLITKEFFELARSRLRPGGTVVFNTITSANFSNRYSVKLDNTIRTVFPNISRQIIIPHDKAKKAYNWDVYGTGNSNVVYSYFDKQAKSSGTYTDNLNTFPYDQ